MDLGRQFYLPRLPSLYYQGAAVVHWELSAKHRLKNWLCPEFHAAFRELLLHTCVRHALLCPTYCLMPDHLHVMFMGLKPSSDQLLAFAFLRRHLNQSLGGDRFQHQAYDHVLRDQERLRNSFARTCGYILDNPVKASLVERPEQWPFSGAVMPGYPTLSPGAQDFWPKFWKIYARSKDPETAKLRRPPISQALADELLKRRSPAIT